MNVYVVPQAISGPVKSKYSSAVYSSPSAIDLQLHKNFNAVIDVFPQ